MSPINMLITLAVVVWCLQIGLGWLQINRFNRCFDKLATKGFVGIGKNSGRFKPKVVIALAFNQQKQVIDGFIMRGYTVFASPRPLTSLNGLYLEQIMPEKLFPEDKTIQDALSIAIKLKK